MNRLMSKANLARFILGGVYIVASIINFSFAINNSQIYRDWAGSALLSYYENLMLSLSNEQLVMVLLTVVIFQLTMGLLILSKGNLVKIGLVMAILFHLIITPWGYWSLPNLLLALVPIYLIRKDFDSSFLSILFSKIR